MAIRTYKVTLDSKNSIAPEPVLLRQGDKTGAVVIDATLMDNGSPVSISGLTPSFMANTADGQAVISDTSGFVIINASGGEFTYQVPSQLGSVPGKVKIAYFSFTDSNGNQSTFDIVFVVSTAADMTKESAKDWVSNLNEIIDQYNQWVNNAHSSWQDFVNENKEIIESIDPGGTLLTEVIAARNGKSNLKTRLDDEHAEVTAQLAQTKEIIGDPLKIGMGFRSLVQSILEFCINVKDYGVKGDGITDDTNAIQTLLDSDVVRPYSLVVFPEGNYRVTNLVLPSKRSVRYYGNGARITALEGGSDEYLIASSKFVNNLAEADEPLTLEGFVLNGNKIKNYTLVVQNWLTVIRYNQIQGAVMDGLMITTQTINGTNFTTSTLVNNRIYDNWISLNGRNGIVISDKSRNKATDFFIENNLVSENGNTGISMRSCAGTLLKGNHTYGNTQALAVSIASLAFRIVDNYFEETGEQAISIYDMVNGVSTIFQGNTVRGRFWVYVGTAADQVTIKSIGNEYRGDGHIHNEWNTQLTVYSTNDSFETANPYRTNNPGSSPSKFMASNSVSMALGVNRKLEGMQYRDLMCRTIEYANELPTAGYYQRGSKVILLSPSANGIEGYICVSSGTFGTTTKPVFKGYGAIQA